MATPRPGFNTHDVTRDCWRVPYRWLRCTLGNTLPATRTLHRDIRRLRFALRQLVPTLPHNHGTHLPAAYLPPDACLDDDALRQTDIRPRLFTVRTIARAARRPDVPLPTPALLQLHSVRTDGLNPDDARAGGFTAYAPPLQRYRDTPIVDWVVGRCRLVLVLLFTFRMDGLVLQFPHHPPHHPTTPLLLPVTTHTPTPLTPTFLATTYFCHTFVAFPSTCAVHSAAFHTHMPTCLPGLFTPYGFFQDYYLVVLVTGLTFTCNIPFPTHTFACVSFLVAPHICATHCTPFIPAIPTQTAGFHLFCGRFLPVPHRALPRSAIGCARFPTYGDILHFAFLDVPLLPTPAHLLLRARRAHAHVQTPAFAAPPARTFHLFA